MDTTTLRSRLAEFPDMATTMLAALDNDTSDHARIELLTQGLTLSNAEKAALAVELAACRAGHPDPDPPTPSPLLGVQFGSSGRNGGNDLAATRTRFGNACDGRWFDSGDGLDRLPNFPDGMGGHASWKVLQDGRIIDAGVAAAIGHLDPAIHLIEVEHEHDVKHQKVINANPTTAVRARADADLALRLQLKADFAVSATKVDARWADRTVSTVAAHRFSSDAEYDEWKRLYVGKAAILGVDWDGTTSVAGKPYANYADKAWLDRIADAATRYYDGRLTGPEFGWPQRPDDTTGTLRAQALTVQATAIVKRFPDLVQLLLFDAASFPGYPLVDDPEVNAWRALVATNK